jgi:hypothetical protein
MLWQVITENVFLLRGLCSMGRVKTKVTLVRATHESEELIASAGKLCYAHNTRQIFRSDS